MRFGAFSGRVEPSTGRKAHHPGIDVAAYLRCGEAAPTRVPNHNDVAINDAALDRIHPAERQLLAAGDLAIHAVARMVELAVQAPLRLIGDEVQRIFRSNRRVGPLRRREPCRMADAVRDASRRHLLRKQLNTAGGSWQWMGDWIRSKFLQEDDTPGMGR